MSEQPRRYPVHRAMLPLYCPTRENALWSSHPRVYLPIKAGEDTACPYCGTVFFLQDDKSQD